MTVMSNLVAFFFSFFSMSENYILTVPDLVIFFKMLLKKHKLYHLIKEIDLGLFFLGSIGHLGLQCFFFLLFSYFSSKKFLGFFLFESSNILLSRTNYEVKFNFIGIKKLRVFPNIF